MMAVAVNCLVKEARRKFVFASIGRRVRRSVTPYPRRNTGCPLWITRTAAPGAVLDFRGAKMASIWEGETWAAAEKAKRTRATRSVFASLFFKASPRCSGIATFSSHGNNLKKNGGRELSTHVLRGRERPRHIHHITPESRPLPSCGRFFLSRRGRKTANPGGSWCIAEMFECSSSAHPLPATAGGSLPPGREKPSSAGHCVRGRGRSETVADTFRGLDPTL